MRRKHRKRKFFLLLLFIFIVSLFLSKDWVEKQMYPIEYEYEIKANAEKYELDPFLIAAIIRVESNFQTEVQSHKGAYGLMQLMPNTSEWIITTGKFLPGYRQLLHHPAVSIELGAWYLHWLHDQFDGNTTVAIAAYNAGQGKVRKWLEEGLWDGSLEKAAQVPYGETRHYIQRVLYYQDKYTQLYEKTWSEDADFKWTGSP